LSPYAIRSSSITTASSPRAAAEGCVVTGQV
jgi:hypothetical protein